MLSKPKAIQQQFWILLPIFLAGAVWTILSFVGLHTEVEEISRGIISKATMDGVSIGGRKAFFTNSFIILGIWTLAFYASLHYFKNWLISNKDNFWPLSLGALGVLFTFISPVFHSDLSQLRVLIASCSIAYCIGLLLKLKRKDIVYTKIGGITLFVSINLFTPTISLGLGVFCISTLLILGQYFLPKAPPLYTRIYGIPLASILIVILAYIFKIDVGLFGLALCFGLGLALSWYFKRKEDTFILIALIQLVCIGYWGTDLSYFYDMFETANPSNTIQRIMSDGELPFVHYLSSHLLSEQVIPVMHDLLVVSPEKLDWMSWLFMLKVINAVIVYHILKPIIGSPLYSFVIIIFFSFTQWIFPKEYVIGLLPLLMIYKLEKASSVKSFIVLFGVLFLGLFWKIDSGIGAFVASMATLYVLIYDQILSGRNMLKGFVFVSGALVIIFGLIQTLHPPLMDNLITTIEYFTGDQAHGRSVLTNSSKDFVFHFQHYIFPVLILLGFTFVMFTRTKGNPLLVKTIVFLAVFYFMNFQRGLVRHSFTSGSDIYLSSFGYLILILILFYLLDLYGFKLSPVKKLLLFCIVGGMSLSVLSYGNRLKKKDVMSLVIEKIQSNNDGVLLHQKWLEGRNEMLSKESTPFKSYMDKVLKEDETFFDFSNRPLLYYLTDRSIPSYFNQLMQNTVTDRQQKLAIERLQKRKVPIVVYSYIPRAWLDATDDVPNGLRYHIVHHFIKENYTPIGQLNNKWLWLRKDLNTNMYKGPLTPYTEQQWNVDLGRLPGYFSPDTSSIGNSLDFYKISGLQKSGKVKATMYNKYGAHNLTFDSHPNKGEYLIPADWLAAPVDSIRIENNTTFKHQKVKGKY